MGSQRSLRHRALLARPPSLQRGGRGARPPALPRMVARLRARRRSAAWPLSHRRRLSFDRARVSRTDDPIRRPAFRRARVFVRRTSRAGARSRLAKLRAQKISLWPASDLVGEDRQSLGMKIVTTLAEAQAQAQKKPRVLVPTMGALHKAKSF